MTRLLGCTVNRHICNAYYVFVNAAAQEVVCYPYSYCYYGNHRCHKTKTKKNISKIIGLMKLSADRHEGRMV